MKIRILNIVYNPDSKYISFTPRYKIINNRMLVSKLTIKLFRYWTRSRMGEGGDLTTMSVIRGLVRSLCSTVFTSSKVAGKPG